MSTRTAARLAWSLAGLTASLMIGAVFLVWLDRASPWRADDQFSLASMVVGVLSNVPVPIIGVLIATRQPYNPYGWLWLASGVALSFTQLVAAYAFHGLLIAPGTLPLAELAWWLTGAAWLLNFATGPFALLLFPTGHLPSRKWRIVVWVVVGALLTGLPVGWVMPGLSGFVPDVANPYGAQGIVADVVTGVAILSVMLIIIAIMASVLSLLLRFRRATGVERQQLKWFTYGAVLVGAVLISDFFYTLPGVWESVKEGIAFNMLPPLTIGVAILRYQLYDIDVIIRRTLVYSLLTLTLGLIYIGCIVLSRTLVASLIGGSEVAIVASTLAIAALFNPLRRRIQNIIDKRFYRRKYDAAKVLAAFGTTARDETDLSHLTAELLRVVDSTMQPEFVGLWLRETPALSMPESARPDSLPPR
jgi:branched-subunit amino acid transport protein